MEWLSSVAGRGRDHRGVTAHPSEPSAQLRRPHRQDAAIAKWRQSRAVELACAGHPYESIARQVGYANRGTAWKVVQKALDKRVVDHVDELRELTLARLEKLLKAHWPRAMAGDVAAANIVLRIVAQEIRLLGLEWTGENAPTGPVSIIQSSV